MTADAAPATRWPGRNTGTTFPARQDRAGRRRALLGIPAPRVPDSWTDLTGPAVRTVPASGGAARRHHEAVAGGRRLAIADRAEAGPTRGVRRRSRRPR